MLPVGEESTRIIQESQKGILLLQQQSLLGCDDLEVLLRLGASTQSVRLALASPLSRLQDQNLWNAGCSHKSVHIWFCKVSDVLLERLWHALSLK